jgi:hypothetical protein
MSRKQVVQDRTCAELTVKPDKKQEEEIKQAILDGDIGKASQLRAAFLKANKWNVTDTINVVFESLDPVGFEPIYDNYGNLIGPDLNEDKNEILLTSSGAMDTKNGPMDPLQLEFIKQGTNINISEAIETIVQKRIAPLVGMTITFDLDNKWDGNYRDNEIVISFKQTGAWSYVGTGINNKTTQRPTMNFGWFDVATVIHEFCHALGMIHEHQNPYGTEIDWNKPELYQWAQDTQGWGKEQTNTQIIDKYNQNDINGSAFDPCSVMLYFYPAYLTNNNVGTSQNLRMSPVDMEWLANQYPGGDFDGKSGVEEFYLSIYPDEDSDGFDDKIAACETMAAQFGESQPNTTSSGMLSGGNIRNIIIGLLAVLIVALLLK